METSADETNTTCEANTTCDATPTVEDGGAETFAFQAEINQLLSLIINTFYSNKDVFLRELVSNSSDAIDKIRHLCLTDAQRLEKEPRLGIRISTDLEQKTLTIEDTGIGMTKSDLIQNLGTIAQSGTRGFMESIRQANADLSMIGQFGVGFYSAYLVADKVVVHSKHDDDSSAYTWTSSAGGTFTIAPFADETLKRGTRMVLHLKDDQHEYLETSKLTQILKRHSEFITYPIELLTTRTEEKEVEDTDDATADATTDATTDEVQTPEEPAEDDRVKIEELNEEDADEQKPPKTKRVQTTTTEWVTQNKQPPIWTKTPADVTKDEYAAFYKALTNDWEEHLAVKHFACEGNVEFKSVIFIPKRAPFDLFENKKKRNNVRLYVKRVFISDECDDLIPEWLSFVRGVVDSEDLPLNISRETLQQNKIMKLISKNLVKKTIELIHELSENDDDYKSFYGTFSKNLKLGVYEDQTHREKLASYLRFATTHDETTPTSLDGYIERMSEKQESIYYITGESVPQMRKSPFIEALVDNNFEVLLFDDPIDEYVTQQLRDYKGKKLVCCTKEGLSFEGSRNLADDIVAYEPLCKKIKEVLGESVEKVVVSHRVSKSPCCLVTSEYGWSANMERIMKAQALRDTSMSQYMTSKKIMEVNPSHPIVKEMLAMTQAADAAVADYVWLLYDTSTLSSGFTLAEPTAFSERLYKLVQLGMKGDIHECGLGSTFSDVDGPTEPTAITAPDVAESAVAVEMEQVD
jgi:molecular chaperone HtpG